MRLLTYILKNEKALLYTLKRQYTLFPSLEFCLLPQLTMLMFAHLLLPPFYNTTHEVTSSFLIYNPKMYLQNEDIVKKFIFRYLSVPLTDGLWNIFMEITNKDIPNKSSS